MAKQITRDRKLTREEAAKYRKIREEVELEKPEIIAKAQRARCEARRQQLAAIMQELKAASGAQELSLKGFAESDSGFGIQPQRVFDLQTPPASPRLGSIRFGGTRGCAGSDPFFVFRRERLPYGECTVGLASQAVQPPGKQVSKVTS